MQTPLLAILLCLLLPALPAHAGGTYEASRPRTYYAPIIYAPLTGLAFAPQGSTCTERRYAEALKAVHGNICSLTHNAGFNAMFLA